MKIIKAYADIICRVYCAICDEKKWFQFEKVKEKYNKYVINYKFESLSKLKLIDRLKFIQKAYNALKAWKTRDEFILTMMPVTLQELDELYLSIYSSLESVFSEDEFKYIRTCNKPENIPCNEQYKIFFKSKSGLTISENTNYGTLTIGFTISSDIERKQLKNSLFRCILTSNVWFLSKHSGSLTRKETVELMATINYLVNLTN